MAKDGGRCHTSILGVILGNYDNYILSYSCYTSDCLYKDKSLIKILVKQALFSMQMDYGLLLFTTVKHHAET